MYFQWMAQQIEIWLAHQWEEKAPLILLIWRPSRWKAVNHIKSIFQIDAHIVQIDQTVATEFKDELFQEHK